MQLQHSFQNILIIPPITPQSAIFGFIDHKVNCHLINHILLIFKYYVYETRENGSLDLKVLKRNIHKIKKYRKTNKSQQTRKKKKKLETIVHIVRILKYMAVQQLRWGTSNFFYLFIYFFFQYDVSFYTSCVITAVLKTDA